MSTSDHLVVGRAIPAGIDAVWHALTTPELVGLWLTACRPVSRSHYAFTFTEDGGPHTKHLHILQCNPRPPRPILRGRLEDPGYDDSVVEVSLSATPEPFPGTQLRLVHETPPAELVEGYLTGWRDYLDRLAEHLRETAPAREARDGR